MFVVVYLPALTCSFMKLLVLRDSGMIKEFKATGMYRNFDMLVLAYILFTFSSRKRAPAL